MDDTDAVRRLKAGDMGGLEILVARYQRRAVQTAFLITRDEQLAEDVAQDTFVRIYQGIRRFDEGRPFGPYLLRSVVNNALNACAKTARWVHVESGADFDAVAGLLERAASTEEEAERARLKREIDAALLNLPPRQRAAIVQRYYLGMSEKEMADRLEAPPGTVKWLLNNARTRLRDLLGAERSAE